jgi:hypothetical protein
MWRTDKELGSLRRTGTRKCLESWEAEMREAEEADDWHLVWALALTIAGAGLGPKKRTYGGATSLYANADEWARYLEQEAPKG